MRIYEDGMRASRERGHECARSAEDSREGEAECLLLAWKAFCRLFKLGRNA